MGRHETKTKALTRRGSIPGWTCRRTAGCGCSTADNGREGSKDCRKDFGTVATVCEHGVTPSLFLLCSWRQRILAPTCRGLWIRV